MPIYTIRDPRSGKTVKLRGDTPPSQEVLDEVFGHTNRMPDTAAQDKVDPEQEINTFMQPVKQAKQAPDDLPPPVMSDAELKAYHEQQSKKGTAKQDVEETFLSMVQNMGAAAISGAEAVGRMAMMPFTGEDMDDVAKNLQANLNRFGYSPKTEGAEQMLEGMTKVLEPIDTATFRAGTVFEDIPVVGPGIATATKVGLDVAIGALAGRLAQKGVSFSKAKIDARAQIKAERAAQVARKRAAEKLFVVKEQEKAAKLGAPTSTPSDRSGILQSKREFMRTYVNEAKGTGKATRAMYREAENKYNDFIKQSFDEEDMLWRAEQARLEAELQKNPIVRDFKKTEPIDLPKPRKGARMTQKAANAAEAVGDFMGTVVSRLDSIDPTRLLSNKIRKMEWNIESKMVFRNQALDDFYKISKKMYNSKLAGNWHRAYLDQDWNRLQALAIEAGVTPKRFRAWGGSVPETFKAVRDVVNEMGAEAIDSGFRGFALIKNYMPRHLNEASLRAMADTPEFEQLIGVKRMKRLERALKKNWDDEVTRMEALNSALTGGGTAKIPAAVSQHAKKRGALQAEELYDPAHVALQRYVNDMTESIEIRKFLGKHKRSLDDSLAAFMDEQDLLYKLSAREHTVLKNVLEARFKEGRMHSPKFVQSIKNFGYITSIGNVWSALTQIGDIMSAARTLGLKNTMGGLKDIASLRAVRTSEIGYEQIMKELADPSRSSKWLDAALTASGFKMMDKLGKTVIVNASKRRFMKLAKTDKGRTVIGKQYAQMFKNAPDEYAKFLDDLAEGNIKNDNVKMAIFNDLADLQPITLSDMPLSYLRNPRGRLFWALKTWSAQQLNTLYRHSVQEWKRGNKIEGTKNLLKFAAYTTILGTAGIDTFKQWLAKWLAGEDLKPEDIEDNVTEAFFRTLFISRYSIEKARGKTDFWHMLTDVAAPSLQSTILRIERALGKEGGDEKAKELLKVAPIVGSAFGAVEREKEND